ncbi:MAG: NADH-quinone oxidoreductase subunit I, partial [Betaproteobacteria bacterium]|nr:NADH-quinone oxidoreductase subunit I [Betaproteobacteria bacterium]
MTTLESHTYRPAFSWKDFFSSFLLLEMFKGMAITGKYMFAKKITVQFPEEKTPLSPRF